MNNKKFDLVTVILAFALAILAIVAVLSFSKRGKQEIGSALGLNSGNSISLANAQEEINPNSPYYNSGSYVASQSNNNGPVINMHSVNYSPEVSFLAEVANNNNN